MPHDIGHRPFEPLIRLLRLRALLRNPAVLVLDEPTAPLDPDTEREIVADQVITLDGGKISEQAVAAAR